MAAPPPSPPAAEHASLAGLPRGPISRQLWLLALPMLSEQFVHFLVGMVDTWLAGRVSKEATAAVGTASYMGWFIGLTFMLFCSATGALVARFFGADDRPAANRTMNQGTLLILAFGLCGSAAAWLLAPTLADFLTQTAVARDLFVVYLRIDAYSYFGAALLWLIASVLRAAGDTRTPMAVMIVVNIVNTVVSAGLVYGWFGVELGVQGIAWGTVIARWTGALLAALLMMVGWRDLRWRARLLWPEREMLGRILHVALPSVVEAVLMVAGQVFFVKIVTLTATGDAATVNYAAHVIAMRLEALTYLPATAWMTAAATLVGQYLGARRPDDAGRAAHRAALQTVALTSCVGLTFFIGADYIYAAMTTDPAVRAVGAHALRILGLMQPVLGAAIVYHGSLRGAGDTRYTMFVSLIGAILLRIPGAYFVGVYLHGGLLGAWCGMWADNGSKFALGLGRYLQGGWRRVRV